MRVDATRNEPAPGGLFRTPLREQLKDAILERIFAGEFAPGDRLVESRLARELAVSQASVREALRDLEQLGFVEYKLNRGCSVRSFSTAEMLEAYPVRAALEALAAREAAPKVTAADLDRLQHLLEGMRRCARAGERREQALLNAEFHGVIVQSTGNQTLIRQWGLLEPYARTLLTTVSAADLEQLAERHEPILAALVARDPAAAAAAMSEHLLEAASTLALATAARDPATERDDR